MVLIVSGTVVSIAQNKNITVSGKIVEADTQEPVIQATVQLLSLPDSTYINGAATITQGRFTLPKASAGKYLLKITYIGFQPSLIPLELTANKLNVNVGTIELESDAILLEEAVITAEAPPVTVKEDTTVYSASAYRTAEGAMLEELVKKLPGAEVSEDGKITINGKEVKKIMVDGKEFFSDDPNVSMKNLPVEIVENVKAYDRKSDMARITGIDDGEEETVLDLTVKKGMKRGWFGNVITGYGSDDRYEAGAMVNRFRDDQNLTILGSANNTNNRGFSEFGDAGQGMSSGGGRSGITSARSLGMNFAKDTKKLQIGGNVQYGYSDNNTQRRTSETQFLGENESSYSNDSTVSNRQRHDVRADFRLEWRPDTMTTIIFRPNASYSHTDNSNFSLSETLNSSRNPVNRKREDRGSKSNNFSFNGRLQLFRKLNNEGRNLSLSANFGYSDSDTKQDTESTTEFFEVDSISNLNRHTDQNADSRNWSVGASYTEPVFKNHFLQLRYEFSHRKRLSESLLYDRNSLSPDIYVDSLSSRVENFYDSHSIDASLRGIYPKMMYSAGLTFVPQSSQSETTIGPNKDNKLPTQKVFNFAPQLMFRYSFNKQHTLMLRYRGRSTEPNILYLQEIIDQTNPLNISYGNPNLKPSFTHNVMMFYNRYFPTTMRSYAMNLFFNTTQNSVGDRESYDPVIGKSIRRKVNINGNWDVRGHLSFTTPLRNKKFTLSSNTSSSFRNDKSYTSVQGGRGQEGTLPPAPSIDVDAELSTTHDFVIDQRLTGNYRTDAFDVSLNGSIRYNSTKNNKQTKGNGETFDYLVGGNTNINLPWKFYLSTDINYRIKEGYSQGFNNNEIIWNAQVSKNFLKNSAATLRFKIYDILQQQTNLSRSITQTKMTDTETNMLGSYFMVHFVYRFNTLGGKAPQRRGLEGERRRGPGGPGGRAPGGGRPF